MKKILFLLMPLLMGTAIQAQTTTMRDVFTTMPDSLLPTLTRNNRLDMVDFREAKMRAEVSNLLEGSSELLSLSADSLTLRLSEALTVRMRLLTTQTPYDSCQQVVSIERTYTLASDSTQETTLQLYTLKWRPLSSLSPADQPLLPKPRPSTILGRDQEIFDKNQNF